MYLWMKALHIIFVITWFAGLFYIFRLFVYHVQNKDNKEITSVFETMEKKLLYIIMHPSMALALIFGFGALGHQSAFMKSQWIWIKLLLVLLLIAYQIFAGIVRKKFAKGNYFLSEKACRLINEVPAVLLIAIVLLVVLKPF